MPADDVQVGRVLHLCRVDRAFFDRFLQPGMVDVQLLDAPCAHQVGARIAGRGGVQPPPDHPGTGQGRAHAFLLGVIPGRSQDALIGLTEGRAENLGGMQPVGTGHPCADPVDSHLGGHLAGLVPADPVAQDGKDCRGGILLRKLEGRNGEVVLVVLPHHAHVGQGGHVQVGLFDCDHKSSVSVGMTRGRGTEGARRITKRKLSVPMLTISPCARRLPSRPIGSKLTQVPETEFWS